MNRKKRLSVIAVAGTLLLGGGFWVRHKITHSPAYLMAHAMKNPRFKQMDAEVGRLQAAVAAAPRSVEARWALAHMYQKLGVIDMAAEQLREITALDPNDSVAAVALANVELAMLHPEAAKTLFLKISQHWPAQSEAWQGLAVVAYKDRRFEESVRYIRKAIKLQPKNHNYRFILGNSLQSYAQQFPTPDLYAPILALARREYEIILPTWPDQADIRVRLGNICVAQQDAKASVEHFSVAVKLLPNRPDIANELAVAYVGAGKRDMAQTVIDQAIAHGPDYAPLYALRGQILQHSNEPAAIEKIVASYQKAASLAPKNAGYWERLGTALVRQRKYPEARTALERAVALNPERAAPYQQLAAVYTRLGDLEMAGQAAKIAGKMIYNEQRLKQLEQLSETDPRDMTLHIVLADRYRDLSLFGPASAKYRLVLKFEPHNKRALEGLQAIERLRLARSGGQVSSNRTQPPAK